MPHQMNADQVSPGNKPVVSSKRCYHVKVNTKVKERRCCRWRATHRCSCIGSSSQCATCVWVIFPTTFQKPPRPTEIWLGQMELTGLSLFPKWERHAQKSGRDLPFCRVGSHWEETGEISSSFRLHDTTGSFFSLIIRKKKNKKLSLSCASPKWITAKCICFFVIDKWTLMSSHIIMTPANYRSTMQFYICRLQKIIKKVFFFFTLHQHVAQTPQDQCFFCFGFL